MTRGQSVIGYTRVSTADQGDSGLGLEAQKQRIREECDRRGWQLLDIIEDVASGRSINRPGLDRTLQMVQDGHAAGIVVAKLDRLSRSVIDFAGLLADAQRHGWNICAIDFGLDLSTPQGKLVANVLMSVAEWEREMIGVRTREALAVARANGVRVGRPSRTGFLREWLRVLRAAGMTFRAIADDLNTLEIPTAHGGARWHGSTVAAVLRSGS